MPGRKKSKAGRNKDGTFKKGHKHSRGARNRQSPKRKSNVNKTRNRQNAHSTRYKRSKAAEVHSKKSRQPGKGKHLLSEQEFHRAEAEAFARAAELRGIDKAVAALGEQSIRLREPKYAYQSLFGLRPDIYIP